APGAEVGGGAAARAPHRRALRRARHRRRRERDVGADHAAARGGPARAGRRRPGRRRSRPGAAEVHRRRARLHRLRARLSRARLARRRAWCKNQPPRRRGPAMRTRRLVLAVLAALAFVTGASAAPPKDAIVIGLVAEPVTMDPPQITDLNSARVTKRIFEGLVGQELGSYKLVPALAHSWDISKDGLTYTFKLRPNVKFHDGTPFNAEAVKFVVKHPVGTGPFKLEMWEPGVKVVLARNDAYWGGAPKIRQAIYVPIVEAQARLVALKTGDIDLTMDVPPDSLDELRRDPNLVVAESNSSAVWYVTLNTRHPILKDRRVRQALNHAVNKEAIIRDILRGTAIVSRGPISPAYGPYYEENTARYPYDLEKARALLKEAGHANGVELTFLVPESGSGM